MGTVGEGDPTIQPLLTVHDELAGQAPLEQKEFTRLKLRKWFDVTLRIGSIDVKIPSEGALGTSWGSCPEPL